MSTPIEDLYERTPHVDSDWTRQAVTELALRDVSGENIGAALLEVESHMAEHGGDTHEVFGEPKAYAAALELPDTEKLSRRQWVGVWLPALLMFAGVSVVLNGVLVLLGGGGLRLVPVGIMLLALAIGAAAAVTFDALRVIVARPVVSGIVLFLAIGALGIGLAFVPGPVLDLSPWVTVPAGVLLLAAGVLQIRRLRRRAEAGRIRFPTA